MKGVLSEGQVMITKNTTLVFFQVQSGSRNMIFFTKWAQKKQTCKICMCSKLFMNRTFNWMLFGKLRFVEIHSRFNLETFLTMTNQFCVDANFLSYFGDFISYFATTLFVSKQCQHDTCRKPLQSESYLFCQLVLERHWPAPGWLECMLRIKNGEDFTVK